VPECEPGEAFSCGRRNRQFRPVRALGFAYPADACWREVDPVEMMEAAD